MSDPVEDTMVLRSRIVPTDAVLRPTRAEVDLEAIAWNFELIRREAGGARLLCVVKADAYGHGVLPVAKRLEAQGALGFGVALAEEAIELREAGIAARVLILNGIHGSAHAEIVERGLTPVVYELHEARAFSRVAGDRPFPIHLKVDTGMSRLGVPLKRLSAFLDGLAALPNLLVEGVMTHLASADVDPVQTEEQLRRFTQALADIRARGHRPTLVHASNSAATFRHPEARFDLVRPGIAIYGYPGADIPALPLRPAMRLRSAIISLRDIEAGDGVGYCANFVASRPTRIATVPMGYGDGYFRSLGNRAEVLVHGRRCPIVGNVSMDLIGIDVTGIDEVAIGDEVVLLGRQGSAQVTAEELAEWAGTIPYEILTNVSRRVPRFYLEKGN